MAAPAEVKLRVAKRDEAVKAELDAGFLEALGDFALVVCDGCGLEVVDTAGSGPCLVCGSETASTSPRHDVEKAGLRITLLGLDHLALSA